jgi:Ca2+-binding EF-hand superfamily protein
MKKQLIFAALAGCLFGNLQVSALADEVWFNSYDTDGDHYWTYPEFTKAHEHYVKIHPKTAVVTTTQLRKDFDDLDVDHDGKVKIEEVRTYHTW